MGVQGFCLRVYMSYNEGRPHYSHASENLEEGSYLEVRFVFDGVMGSSLGPRPRTLNPTTSPEP